MTKRSSRCGDAGKEFLTSQRNGIIQSIESRRATSYMVKSLLAWWLTWTAITLATFSCGGLKKIKTFTRVGSPYGRHAATGWCLMGRKFLKPITPSNQEFPSCVHSPSPNSQTISQLIRVHDPASPAPFSIALSISEKWLISHEDESDDATCCCAARELLH